MRVIDVNNDDFGIWRGELNLCSLIHHFITSFTFVIVVVENLFKPSLGKFLAKAKPTWDILCCILRSQVWGPFVFTKGQEGSFRHCYGSNSYERDQAKSV